jgi:dCMP deaminase
MASSGTRPSWDEYFLNIARVVSERSHDIHTKHGCVLTLDNRIIGTGYNAWPAGVDWGKEFLDRPLKYEPGVFLHAEINALANRTTSDRGFTAYITGQPCINCLVNLGQNGVSRLVYPKGYSSKIIESENMSTRASYLSQKAITIKEI